MTSPLYSLDVLRLAAGTGDFPRLSNAQATVERLSRTCGSRITVDISLDDEGRVVCYGHEVRACAVGQAAATLVARHAAGQSVADLVALADGMRSFISGEHDALPTIAGFDALIPIRGYPARHEAALMAIDAAVAAATEAAA